MKTYEITINVPYDDVDAVHEWVTRAAEKDGSTVEQTLSFLISCGLRSHVQDNLKRFYMDDAP